MCVFRKFNLDAIFVDGRFAIIFISIAAEGNKTSEKENTDKMQYNVIFLSSWIDDGEEDCCNREKKISIEL